MKKLKIERKFGMRCGVMLVAVGDMAIKLLYGHTGGSSGSEQAINRSNCCNGYCGLNAVT